jgi:sugar transferase (PEP-CTERM/EpsH1 system associated)
VGGRASALEMRRPASPGSGVRPGARVGHVIHALTSGGMERGILNIVNYGDWSRFQHVIVCLTSADDIIDEIRSPVCEVIQLRKASGNDWRLPVRLARALRQARLDVVHARGWPTLVETAVGAALARIRETVYSFHGRTVEDLHTVRRRRQWVQRLVTPRYRRIVTLNPRMRQELAAECGVPERAIEVIPNGVDTVRFCPLPNRNALREKFDLPDDRYVLGSVGRLDPVKNHLLLLRALRRCSELSRRPFVVLVGEGSERLAIEREIARLGLTGDVRLYGHRTDIGELLNCFDAYVQTSLYEGFSNTLLEAMSCGLPVLATNVGGTADIVSSGREGWLFESGDDEQLAALLERLISESGGAVMGRRGRELVLDRYSILTMVSRYEHLYGQLATSGRRPRR